MDYWSDALCRVLFSSSPSPCRLVGKWMVSRPCNVRMRLAAAAQPKARAIILRLPRIATVAARRRWDWPIAREIMPHLIDRGATSARVDRLNAGGTPPGYRRTRLRGAPRGPRNAWPSRYQRRTAVLTPRQAPSIGASWHPRTFPRRDRRHLLLGPVGTTQRPLPNWPTSHNAFRGRGE